MRRSVIGFCLAIHSMSIAGVLESDETALYNARKYGAHALERIRAVDGNGDPVAGARVVGVLQTGGGYDDYTSVVGMTDANGEYAIRGKCTNTIKCDIFKAGYYDSTIEWANYGYRHQLLDGKWQPYGNATKLVLKKIVNPVVAGIRHIDRKIPAFGEWLGFDLEMAEWTAPWGGGKRADAMIRFTAREVGPFDFGYKMEISFAHVPLAGIVRRKKDGFSLFQCDYNAVTNDTYEKTIVFEVDRTASEKRIWNPLGDDEYLIFRIRTKVDSNGELASAHYGRIDGEWNFHQRHSMWIRGVHFNSTPNDTNLEDVHSFREAMRRKRHREENSNRGKRDFF